MIVACFLKFFTALEVVVRFEIKALDEAPRTPIRVDRKIINRLLDTPEQPWFGVF